jgi:hypothetical protein
VHTHLTVELNGGVADERRQLPCGPPPSQIHLEEAILRVDEAGGPRHVRAGNSSDGGNAEAVALYRDGGLQPSYANRAVDARQARAELGSSPVGGSSQRHDKGEGGERQDP